MRLLKYLLVPALILSLDSYSQNWRLREKYVEEAECHLRRESQELSSRTAKLERDQIKDIFPLGPERPIQAWSIVPPGMMEREMSRFYDKYSNLITNKDSWQSMTSEDWGRIHAPARVAAFAGMVDFWIDYYDAGEGSGIPKNEMSNTLKAIMIGESYLDHNAINKGDYGISQISKQTRNILRRWFKKGRNGIDFNFKDADYMNPHNSIRAGVYFFNHVLENEAGGDLKLAIRAYNAGINGGRKNTRRAVRYQKGIEGIIKKYLTDAKPSNSPLYVALKIERDKSSN